MIEHNKSYNNKAIYSSNLSKEIVDKLSDFLNQLFEIQFSKKVYNAILYHVVNTIVENVIYRVNFKTKYNHRIPWYFLPRNLKDFQSQVENENLNRLIQKKFCKHKKLFVDLRDFSFLKIFIKNMLFRKKHNESENNFKSKIQKPIVKNRVDFFKIDYRHKKEINKILATKKNWKISNLKKISLIHGKKDEKLRSHFFKKLKSKNINKNNILSIIVELIPSQYFEMFYENFQSVGKVYKQTPKLIISNAHNWYSNDQFKFFLGFCLANNSKYVDVQINGAHFLTEYSSHYNISKRFSDFFISWGHQSKNKKIINLPCLYNCLLPNNKKEYANKILYVGASIADHFKGFWGSYLDGGQIIEYQSFRNLFFEKLNLYLKKNFIIRMRDTNKISKNYSNKFLKKNNFLNSLEKIECSLSERITKNDLKFIVVDHVSTPFLEIIHSNIPFILLLNPKYNFFNKKYNYLVKEMIKEKILFYNPKKAADYLNKINIDIKYLNWKKDVKIQNIRQETMKQFYNQDKNWVKKWRSKIEKIS